MGGPRSRTSKKNSMMPAGAKTDRHTQKAKKEARREKVFSHTHDTIKPDEKLKIWVFLATGNRCLELVYSDGFLTWKTTVFLFSALKLGICYEFVWLVVQWMSILLFPRSRHGASGAKKKEEKGKWCRQLKAGKVNLMISKSYGDEKWLENFLRGRQQQLACCFKPDWFLNHTHRSRHTREIEGKGFPRPPAAANVREPF